MQGAATIFKRKLGMPPNQKRTQVYRGSAATTENRKPCKAVITLIHGTYAPYASWTQDSSPLCKALGKVGDGRVVIERFVWSGRNRFSDRVTAADELALLIRKQSEAHSQVPQYVIAHSHGGSVLAYMLSRNTDAANAIAGAAFLATPFVDARVRPDWDAIFAVTAIAIWTTCTAAFLFGLGILNSGDPKAAFILLTLLALGLANRAGSNGGWFGMLGREGHAQSLEKLSHSLSTSRLPPGRYLFLKCTGDEAASALSTAQFVSWFMSRTISIVVPPLVRYYNYYKKYTSLLAVAIVLVWFVFFMIPAQPDDLSRSLSLLIFLPTLAVVVIAALFSALWLLCCLVGCAGHLSFGRWSFRTAMFIDLAVDTVPIGKHLVVHTSWDDLSTEDMYHSSPYQSPSALKHLMEWLDFALHNSSPTAPRSSLR